MAKVLELIFSDDDDVPTSCRAAALLSSTGTLQIALMEVPGNRGTSVTNSWPGLAKRVLAASFPTLSLSDVAWFEVYPYRLDEEKENVSRVILSEDGSSHRFEYEQDTSVRKQIWQALEIES
ncbi:hypothetical protein XH98_18600 [Bradyrhizobium sp. CCBAU 51745]|uniref:hypothetical protein n=1 Tax=Bradyrhizobium sp. CCBAU 51745 TaxID=1325099 RepID=UPI002305BDB3|nr:hypothetical protein [Bradyrhizobium sp. CCBAU 51745]MDA9441064.1 hypothetical protein [Bradyrhizobium sp. CCBAU 51745]